jgi:hypothetical protein
MASKYMQRLKVYLFKLQNKSLTPIELVDIGREAKSWKIWNIILKKINNLHLPRIEIMELCFKADNHYFSSKLACEYKYKPLKFTME